MESEQYPSRPELDPRLSRVPVTPTDLQQPGIPAQAPPHAQVPPNVAVDPRVQVRPEATQVAVNLEELAERHGLMPVVLPRNSCSAAAENLLRKLGRAATGPCYR